MSKLIVVGTNDPYWPIDSANLYIKELPGCSSMVYAPNAGHGAEVFRVSQAISSMIHHLNTGEPLSSMSYVEEQSEGTLKVRT
ncbi:MAG: alpha/beta hydrolase [Thermotogae bacterium]|nr:alpha/beta hydrolase [Thermotogota bacterium]MCP5461152.1 alpha/beta hydrolase [Thermotogota bacterium]